MKDYYVYVNLYAVVRVPVKGESKNDVEEQIEKSIKTYKFEKDYKENIMRELDCGGFLFELRECETEEVEE